MDKPESVKQEPPEIDDEVEMVDLPEANDNADRWSARLSHTIVEAQSPAHRRWWRVAGIAGTALLAMVVVLVIAGSLHQALQPAQPIVYKYQLPPTFPPTRNYAGFTYLTHPLITFQEATW